MIRYAISFFVLALVAYIFGINGLAGLSMDIGRLLLVVFLILAVLSFVGHLLTGKKIKHLE